MISIVKDVIDINTNGKTMGQGRHIIGKTVAIEYLQIGSVAQFGVNSGNLRTSKVVAIEDFNGIKKVTTLNTIYILEILNER